jgi:replication fork protection complex subunit Csm3/Swi3
MQTMRMDWINEGRPKPVEEDSLFDMPTLTQPGDPARAQIATRIAPIFENARTDRPTTPAVDEDPDEDLYGATPRASKAQPAVGAAPAQGGSIFGPSKTVISDEPDDDLDALLAEAEMENFSASGTNRSANQHQENEIDDDEMEAMAEMDGMW